MTAAYVRQSPVCLNRVPISGPMQDHAYEVFGTCADVRISLVIHLEQVTAFEMQPLKNAGDPWGGMWRVMVSGGVGDRQVMEAIDVPRGDLRRLAHFILERTTDPAQEAKQRAHAKALREAASERAQAPLAEAMPGPVRDQVDQWRNEVEAR